jgi:hypothetical protein
MAMPWRRIEFWVKQGNRINSDGDDPQTEEEDDGA